MTSPVSNLDNIDWSRVVAIETGYVLSHLSAPGALVMQGIVLLDTGAELGTSCSFESVRARWIVARSSREATTGPGTATVATPALAAEMAERAERVRFLSAEQVRLIAERQAAIDRAREAERRAEIAESESGALRREVQRRTESELAFADERDDAMREANNLRVALHAMTKERDEAKAYAKDNFAEIERLRADVANLGRERQALIELERLAEQRGDHSDCITGEQKARFRADREAARHDKEAIGRLSRELKEAQRTIANHVDASERMTWRLVNQRSQIEDLTKERDEAIARLDEQATPRLRDLLGKAGFAVDTIEGRELLRSIERWAEGR